VAIGVGGLAASLGQHPRALDALALAGALLLAAYGAAALRRAWRPQAMQHAAADGIARAPRGRVLAELLAISLLNPHVYLDTVVLVGSIGARQPAGTHAAFLIGAGLASALWFSALGYGARLLAPLFVRPSAWRVLDGVVAATMATLSVGLVAGVLRS